MLKTPTRARVFLAPKAPKEKVYEGSGGDFTCPDCGLTLSSDRAHKQPGTYSTRVPCVPSYNRADARRVAVVRESRRKRQERKRLTQSLNGVESGTEEQPEIGRAHV